LAAPIVEKPYFARYNPIAGKAESKKKFKKGFHHKETSEKP
jgi:hypothetical protein